MTPLEVTGWGLAVVSCLSAIGVFVEPSSSFPFGRLSSLLHSIASILGIVLSYLLPARLLTLCSSNNLNSSLSSGVGSTGIPFVKPLNASRISVEELCVILIVSTLSAGSCAEGFVLGVVLSAVGAGLAVAEEEEGAGA